MISTPWIKVPPPGYGGIENVLYALIPELERLGVEVTLFSTADTQITNQPTLSVYDDGQYSYIHQPLFESAPVITTHLLYAMNQIRADGKFDVIHDHNGFFGPQMFAHMDPALPPVVHTHHGPPFTTPDRLASGLPDNLAFWRELGEAERLYVVGISDALMTTAPPELKSRILDTVYNAVPVEQFPYVHEKDDYFITLARFHPDKGQDLAVRLCLDLGEKLQMAGLVGHMKSKYEIMRAIGDPLHPARSTTDFKYFSDNIYPALIGSDLITYLGDVAGDRKMQFISHSKGLLFPIDWEEPFGMAAIEALACGTPVIAMARGALPEIIEHGVNGWLANDEDEFRDFMLLIDQIDPQACRDSVEKKFSAKTMAQHYLDRYHQVIKLHA
jgi:glycosyltransferase involved in cell wall biosynthesis